MGFWTGVASIAKSVGKAMEEKSKEQKYELWIKLTSLSEERLIDFIEQNEDRRQMKLFGIMALSLENKYSAEKFIDEDVKYGLERIRKLLALEDNRYAEKQRQAIDLLLKSY